MRNKYVVHLLAVLAVLFGILLLAPNHALAHCDTMDGPVVKAAQRALSKRNVNLVLIWVQKKDEPEIRRRFQQTLAVRRLNRDARELADNYFFETVVRLHRAGEGEPYTGVEPAGTDLGPVIPVADKALQEGSIQALLKLFPAPAKADIETRFNDAIGKKSFNENDVESGREYVKAYVTFMHYLEHLYEESTKT
ncbi:MAG TPA: DUF6448 family protein [Pyrinomonadaceae bacterium]|nr:DUF6448 family protein [Pyrinomonadaceae bacterium]